jgi:5-methylcytosine-specific restriction endonuclease McrA
MSVPAEIARQVENRAGGRCEYCLMHQSLQGAAFHVEHVVPTSRSGETELANLAWSCPSCNLHKSDRIEVIDPDTGTTVPLYHPRRHRWPDHIQFEHYGIAGLTPTGRATVDALDFNHPRRLRIRQAEELFNLFPP